MGVRDSLLGKLLGNADRFSDEQVLQTINLLVEHGVKHHATDIHIEPHERFVLVRYRIDGSLRAVHKLPLAALTAIIGQIKTLAHLNETVTDMPQEGHYSTLVEGQDLELGVNTLPVLGGEKVVLHITRHLSRPPSLLELGFWGKNLQAIQDTLAHTHGLIVVSAPRRNGRTSTMHSMLQLLNTPAISIATVEGTIEYRLPGANQTRVKPHHGITFHEGLRAALNQDPNVILVSSLPDRQTADLAVQAAASGHLIIASVHADNAASALSHIRTFTSEPFLLANTIRTVISQRLVRQLCTHCRERYIPSNDQLTEIYTAFGVTTPLTHKQVHELEQSAAKAGMDSNIHVNTTPSHITSLWRAGEDGCEFCNHSGFTGALAIGEVLCITDKLQKPLLEHASATALHKQALKDGFIPMALDGLVKVLRGQTTVAEVLRVTAAS